MPPLSPSMKRALDGPDQLETIIAGLREALTPSAATKAAYSGEFEITRTWVGSLGTDVVEKIPVPWTTIKEIMGMIRDRGMAA